VPFPSQFLHGVFFSPTLFRIDFPILSLIKKRDPLYVLDGLPGVWHKPHPTRPTLTFVIGVRLVE